MATTVTCWADVDFAARQMAGNWKKMESFAWWGRPDVEDLDNFCLVYTHNRDSGPLDMSNAEQYRQALEKFMEGDDPDVIDEDHNHWAVGWVRGYAIRVFRDGQVTEAFKEYARLRAREEDYPVLDEEDYSKRQWEEFESSWKSYACKDFIKELVKAFGLSEEDEELLEDADQGVLQSWWMDHAYEPYHDESSGVYIPTGRTSDYFDEEVVGQLLQSLRSKGGE